jgi:predicted nucleic acid-binding protein
VIGLDTSVLVRYLVGSPAAQAARAARLIDDDAVEYGVSPVALAECAHVLRTPYEVGQRDIIDALIALVHRANIRVIGQRTDVLVETLVRARDLPGRPIPDSMIIAACLAADAVPLATFDRYQRRYGIEIRSP